MKEFMSVWKDESGQGMVEYGLILGGIAIAAVVAVIAIGPKISDMFTGVEQKLPVVPAA